VITPIDPSRERVTFILDPVANQGFYRLRIDLLGSPDQYSKASKGERS